MAITLKNVTLERSSHVILRDASFQFSDNKWTAIVGENGAGKSTLLQAIQQFIPIQQGHIHLDGKIGFLFQHADQQFFESTVEKELRFAPRHFGWSREKTDIKIAEVLNLVQLDASILPMLPYQLSGGQKKRLALALVFMMEPTILLADEPTAGLDPVQRALVLSILKKWQQQGHTIIAITHELTDVLTFADDVLLMAKDKAPQLFETEQFFFEVPKRKGVYFPPPIAMFHLIEQRLQSPLPRARSMPALIQIMKEAIPNGTSYSICSTHVHSTSS